MRYGISHVRSLESFARDYPTLLDAWAAGGVDSLVIGPMMLNLPERLAHSRGEKLNPRVGGERAAFDPDPAVYDEFGVPRVVAGPPDDADSAVREKVLAGMQAAADAGWSVWILDPLFGAVAPDANHVVDRLLEPRVHAALAARMVDTVRAFPMVTGVMIDGPNWGFEISEIPIVHMRQRRLIFEELPVRARAGCERLGHDYDALVRAKDALWTRLHTLDAGQISTHSGDSRGEAMDWLGGPHLAEWIGMRVDALCAFYQHLADVLRNKIDRPVRFAVNPRQPAVAAMAGYDVGRLADLVDEIRPKLYYWHRGYDGLIGTAYRYARTIIEWNPGLSVADACQIARLLFGEAMPIVDEMIDFDRLATPDHVGELARLELGQALADVGGRADVVPWVDTGRAPHDGDPLTALHLEALINAVQSAGLDRLSFFNSTNLTAADWAMLSHYGGHDWDPDTSAFVPYDRPTL